VQQWLDSILDVNLGMYVDEANRVLVITLVEYIKGMRPCWTVFVGCALMNANAFYIVLTCISL